MKMTKAQERIYKLQRCSNSELKALTKAIVWAEKTIGFEVNAENVKAVYGFDKFDYFKGAKAVKEGWNLEERQSKLEAQHEREESIFEAARERSNREYWENKLDKKAPTNFKF